MGHRRGTTRHVSQWASNWSVVCLVAREVAKGAVPSGAAGHEEGDRGASIGQNSVVGASRSTRSWYDLPVRAHSTLRSWRSESTTGFTCVSL